MQIGRAIERCGEQYVVRFAEIKDLVVQESQIGGDDEIDLSVGGARARFRGFDNRPDQGKIQERLPPWNSILMRAAGLENAMSSARMAVSSVISKRERSVL